MKFGNALVLDDEPIIRSILEELLRKHRISVASVGTLAAARAKLKQDTFDLMFLDLCLPDGKGEELLEELKEMGDAPIVIATTGYATIESAVDCMKAGAHDYVTKPFSPLDIEKALKNAQLVRRMAGVNRYLAETSSEDTGFLGESQAVRHVKQLVRRVAPTEATVLITGENGTGKEIVATELHRLSRRANGPFIKVNCAAISETLVESEFFGHEKGAFTGAAQRRQGRFELADGGTILLDEVSEISPGLQAKLLRVLQEREFERVGGNQTIKVDVRVIAATNRNLLESVEKGKFREDLYYRLNVFPLHIPPLREREGDVMLLAKAFLDRFSRKHAVTIPGFSASAIEWLQSYEWPGNVRELQNMIERGAILTEDGCEIAAAALGQTVVVPAKMPSSRTSAEKSSANTIDASVEKAEEEEELESFETPTANGNGENGKILPLEVIEQRYILEALEKTGGNRTHAAAELGISIRTLRNKLSQYRDTRARRQSREVANEVFSASR